MSRGPGAVQREILRVVETLPGCSVYRLQWLVAERLQRVGPAGIEAPYYKSFMRALRGLCEGHDPLGTEERGYASLQEFAEAYPYRTHSLALRGARSAVLPLLVEYAADVGPKFTDVETERYVLAQRRGDAASVNETRDAWRLARREWERLEPGLMAAITEPGAGDAIIDLIVKGREVWGSAPGYSLDRPMREVIQQAAVYLPPDVADLTRDLVDAWLPPDAIKHGSVGAQLWLFADFYGRGRPRISDAAVNWLVERHADVLREEFGYVERPARHRPGAIVLGYGAPRIDGMDHIIGHDAFKRQEYIYPPRQRPMPGS